MTRKHAKLPSMQRVKEEKQIQSYTDLYTVCKRESCFFMASQCNYSHIQRSGINGAQWLSGRVLVSRLRGCRFEPHLCHFIDP